MNGFLRKRMPQTPGIAKGPALRVLFRSTAAAFGCEPPSLGALSSEQCLLAYARFTAAHATSLLDGNGDVLRVQDQLYRHAYALGRVPGRLLRLDSLGDVMALGRLLYSVLDIDMDGSDDGGITIHRCYFSRFYSPEVCKVMSAMDRGLFAGLGNGGELAFSERITEGFACCRARLRLGPRPSPSGSGQEWMT